jgi:hypothetical protein
MKICIEYWNIDIDLVEIQEYFRQMGICLF